MKNKNNIPDCFFNCERRRNLTIFDKENRKYYLRNKKLIENGYCPFVIDCPIVREKKINIQLQIIFDI